MKNLKLKKYWHLFWLFRKVTLMRMMEYRTDFIFWSVVSIFWTSFNIFFFLIITSLSPVIAGWTQPEILTLVSVFTILDAFTWSFFYRNFRFYTQAIFTGFLDFVMTRPIDAQYYLTTQDNSYTNAFRFIIGVGMLVVAVHNLETPPNIFQFLLFIGLVICALLLTYSIWFILSTFAFYVEKLDNINEIFPALRDVFRVPRDVYSGALSFVLTTIFPLLLVTSVPSEVLVGRGQPSWVIFFLFVTGLLFWLSRRFFKFSLQRYQSAGS